MKSNHSQKINKHTWYYENNKSITIVHEVLMKDYGYIQTDQFNIPLSKLKKSIERIDTK